jgi:uncharacterized protein HemX
VAARNVAGGNRPPPPPETGLGERIARVEAAIEGLRHSQNLTIGAIAILTAFVIGFGIYGLQRIDQTQQSISQMQEQMQESISREAAATRQELVGVATAIANSITAAREMQPVVAMPGPSAPPAPAPPSPPRGK